MLWSTKLLSKNENIDKKVSLKENKNKIIFFL